MSRTSAATSSARRTTSASCACSARSAARATARSSSTGRASARRGRRGLEPRLRLRRQHPDRRRTSVVSAFIARTDTPTDAHDRPARQRLLRPRVLQLHEQPLADLGRLFAGRRELQSRSRLPAAPRLSASGIPRLLPAAAEDASSGFAAFAPHVSYNSFWGFDERAAERECGISTRSRFSRSRAAGSDGSSTTTRTTRRRRSRSSIATASAW